jgi:hypothetical protein
VFIEGAFTFTRAWSAHESTAGEAAFAAAAAAFVATFKAAALAFGEAFAFGAPFEAAFGPPFLAAFFGGAPGWSSDSSSSSGCPEGMSSVSTSSTQFVVVCLSIVFLCCVLFDCLV